LLNMQFYFPLLAALSLGTSWWYPDTILSAILTWVSAIFFILSVRQKHALLNLFIAGLIVHPLGFYWLLGTLSEFGKFPIIVSLLIFFVFTALSSLQLVFFAFLYRYLPQKLDLLALRGAVAWSVAEYCSIKIFPWHLGHTQIAFSYYVQFADIVGSIGVSFLLIWTAESLLGLSSARRGSITPLIITTLITITALFYGRYKIENFETYKSTAKDSDYVSIAMIQGNIPLTDKHDPQLIMNNVRMHVEMSRPYDRPENLVIWPETVMNIWIYDQVKHVREDPRLPRLRNASLLFGAPTYIDSKGGYNSTLLIRADGEIGPPYHKRVLMPFGEYTPFTETFPIIRRLNPDDISFIAGTTPRLHEITFYNSEKKLIAASLICYEDVVQDLAVEAANAGAEVLINQTNDAWFGDTIAPYQHHLIATFRAIENRRYLLRATNTGLTAIVDPVGRTVKSLPTYKQGTLSDKVLKMRDQTTFQKIYNLPWLILSIISAVLCAFNMLVQRRYDR
jgi:apolipoprotein N-acyltransferase